MRRFLLLILLGILVGCTEQSPTPTALPLRLPTRAPVTPSPTPIDARPYYEAGLAQHEAGDLEGALQSFTWAIGLAPDFAPAYVARGTVYLAQGRIDLALADAGAALEVDPNSASAHALRGEALRLLGWARQALDAFDQAVAFDPTLKAETFRSRWLAALTVRDGSRLMELSREYGDAYPDDVIHYYYRGWALVEWGTPGTAIDALVEGIESASDPPALLWFALGHAYAANRSWPEAVTCFETVRELVQLDDASLSIHSEHPIPDLFGALGRAYLNVGRCVDAVTMIEYAIAIGAPASEYATSLQAAHICETPVPDATTYPTTTPSSW